MFYISFSISRADEQVLTGDLSFPTVFCFIVAAIVFLFLYPTLLLTGLDKSCQVLLHRHTELVRTVRPQPYICIFLRSTSETWRGRRREQLLRGLFLFCLLLNEGISLNSNMCTHTYMHKHVMFLCCLPKKSNIYSLLFDHFFSSVKLPSVNFSFFFFFYFGLLSFTYLALHCIALPYHALFFVTLP